MGDYTLAKPHSHGNAKSEKKKNENFVPTNNSTKERLKNSQGFPSNEYRKELLMGSTNLLEQLVKVPRDMEQARNFQKAERRRIALTQDVNYNLQEIADDTKFIQEIVSYPDVAIFMYNKELWDLIKGLLNRNDLPYMALTVDTTFNMTDAYVTVLIARFTEFNECPVIPLATMVHERLLKTCQKP